MAEYIKREATCKDCLHYDVCYLIEHYGADEDETCSYFTSAADAVAVVRCKDCAYSNESGTICMYDVGRATQPMGYCDKGEKG